MKKRLLACLLTAAMLVSLFPLPALAAEAERPEWMVTAFDPLDEDTAAQTVPQGGEPVLPDSLTAWAYAIEDDTAVIPPPEGLAQEDEQPQADGPEEAEDNQLPVDNAGEPSTPDVTLVSRTAENTPEPAEKQEPDIQPVTIPGVIWEAQPEFDPDAPGEYVYTPVLPAAYEVAGEVELPVISVTVTAAEQTALQRVQAMIDALPAPEDITAENRAGVEAQLEAIGEAWAELSEADALRLDTARLEAAREALAALDGQENDLPTTLAGDTGDFTVTGGTLGADYSYAGNILTISTGAALTISGSSTTGKIKVNPGTAANIILDDVNIDVSGQEGACAFDMKGATVNLTLQGANTLKSGKYKPAILTGKKGSLTIHGTLSDTLTAYGGEEAAGIGGGRASNDTNNGGDEANGGTIVINGGSLTVYGGRYGAGIGDGDYSGGDGDGIEGQGSANITINGGRIMVEDIEDNGAALGYGADTKANGGSVTISGGEVILRQNPAVGSASVSVSGVHLTIPSGDNSLQNTDAAMNDCLIDAGNTMTIYGTYTLDSDLRGILDEYQR